MQREVEYWLEREKRRENAFAIGTAMLILMQWLDLLTTLQGIGFAGTGTELNPAMRFLLEEHQEIFVLLKLLFLPVLLYFGSRAMADASRTHPESGEVLLNMLRLGNFLGLSMVTINSLQNLVLSFNAASIWKF